MCLIDLFSYCVLIWGLFLFGDTFMVVDAEDVLLVLSVCHKGNIGNLEDTWFYYLCFDLCQSRMLLVVGNDDVLKVGMEKG